jgi:trehalose synthase
MAILSEVKLPSIALDQFRSLLRTTDPRCIQEVMACASRGMRHRTLWNVNSTGTGGGVAELLQSVVPHARAFGIDARWLVISGNPEFFKITKRIHHALLGEPRDDPPLSERERNVYDRTLDANLRELVCRIRPGDVVFLHDPQSAGLAPALHAHGASVVWRCHIGTDTSNEHTEHGWEFMAPYLRNVSAMIFSREALVPRGLDKSRVKVIAPSIDAFSPKNQKLDSLTGRSILSTAGLVGVRSTADVCPSFLRSDNSVARVERRAVVVREGPALDPKTPLVVQVSRWDPLKDPVGVIEGFVNLLCGSYPVEADLMLAGPSVASVADDPEDWVAFEKVVSLWKGLPLIHRRRIHLALLPTADVAENAAIVNALQRHAAVIVQKSLKEGFGLTVTEAMWKARPIVASGVGGILEQIEHENHGLLVDDPMDLRAFANLVRCLLHDSVFAARLGKQAQERVRSQFLSARHLTQYAQLLNEMDIAKERAA